jgi:hypothetical protein
VWNGRDLIFEFNFQAFGVGLLRAQAGLETSFNSTPLHAGTIYECKTSKLPLGYVPGMAPDELIDFHSLRSAAKKSPP